MWHSSIRCLTRSVSLLAVALANACAGSEDAPSAAVVHSDSAGFSIATNTARVETLRPVLTVSDSPRVRIGAESGAPHLLFSNVNSVARLADGRIAVANLNPMEIRIFEAGGAFLARYGRYGQGPGEFETLGWLFPAGGDTLLAVNAVRFQLLRFTARGGYVDTRVLAGDSLPRRLEAARGGEGVPALFRNGALLTITHLDRPGGIQTKRPVGELFRPRGRLSWRAPAEEKSHVLGEFGDLQSMLVDVGGGRIRGVTPPNAKRRITTLGAGGERYCVAGNETPEVRCVDQDGNRSIIRWLQDSVLTTDEMVERWRHSQRAAGERADAHESPQQVERLIAEIIVPPTVPPVSRLIVDRSHRLFVTGPDLIAEKPEWTRYRVFSADGVLLGIADLPAVGVPDIGNDYLLGVARNADGVEFIVEHPVAWSERR